MNPTVKDFLFTKHILVAEKKGENQVETLYALLNQLNVKIVDGFKYANPDMIAYCARMLGEYVPEPFYRGFPNSVRALTSEQRLFDQLVHYTRTYGFGDFEHVGHSLFEDAVDRQMFTEKTEPHEFRILTVEQAAKELNPFCDALVSGTRPLNMETLCLLFVANTECGWKPENVASKSTAVALLWHTKDLGFCRFLSLSDFIKVVDYVNYVVYGKEHINNLNLCNKERKFLTSVLDKLLEKQVSYAECQTCMEKQDSWKGVLHHLHYAPKSENGKAFVACMFGKDIRSAYSRFERMMSCGETVDAAQYLKDRKGNAALLRNLNYIVCNADAHETKQVLDLVDAKSPLVLLQMQNMYRNYSANPRTFKFTRHDRIHTHREEKRKNTLTSARVDQIYTLLEDKLEASLKGKVGKVYIADGMEKIGVPMNMSASESGFGIMPTGSRIALPEGKKIRAFTYWEKVDDVDISCFGINEDNSRTEFSWRTMYNRQDNAITFSGDETSGYHGGSEYFDIDIDAFKAKYPKTKYLVFCNNVFSHRDFSEVVCRAGWMSRDILDSGEVYEPKTVKSAYTINAKTTFAYLYAIDLEAREIIWLNVADSSRHCVAGASEFSWLYDYFTLCEEMNMRKLFTYCANEVVDDPEDADLVVGDIETDKEQIRSFEFEKTLAYLN